MKIDCSEPEKNAAILLSSTTTYVLNQISSLIGELENINGLLQKQVQENIELKEKIKILEDSNKSEPSLYNK